MPFEGFDFSDFWEENQYTKRWNCGPLTPGKIASAEDLLGYQLPASYLWLMERHNGGVPVNRCFRTNTPTNWAEDHIAIETIFGVGAIDDIVDQTRLMREEWGYPDIGIAICDCPTGGHQMVYLDYRECGPKGEPKVVYVDQEEEYSIIPLAENFEEFVRGLVNGQEFDVEEDDE